jgi:hypothetical protein
MTQLDVLKSLMRSSARAAKVGIGKLALTQALQRVLDESRLGRVVISDASLTVAVARAAHVAEATVSAAQGCLRVDVGNADGQRLAMTLRPIGFAFAPGGAKELSFAVEPSEAALDPTSGDVVAAIAGEIARNLWRPALMRAPRSDHGTAMVNRHDGTLIVDLRSVPEVRWALRQRLPALMIEALKPRSLEITQGRVTVALTLDRPM